MVRKHMIALDGKAQSQEAFEWYLENFHRDGDQVCIFHCSLFQLNVGLPGFAVNVESVSKKVKEAHDKAEDITQKAMEKLKTSGIKGWTICRSGKHPADLICEAIVEEQIDHVFMGTRDLQGIHRTLAGSVSTEVARHSKVPVTVIKH